MKFPAHKAALSLEHNDHLTIYQTAAEWIEDHEGAFGCTFSWSSPDARQRCIDTNEVWQLRWYPNTPVGFYEVTAPTLEEVLAAALAVEQEAATATDKP